MRRLVFALAAVLVAASALFSPSTAAAQAQPLPSYPRTLPAIARGWCGLDSSKVKQIAAATSPEGERVASLVGLPSEFPVRAYVMLQVGRYDSTGARVAVDAFCVGRLQRVASTTTGVRYDLYLPPKTKGATHYSKQWSAFSDSVFAYRDSLMTRALGVQTPAP